MATVGVKGLIARHRTAGEWQTDYRAIPASSGVFKGEWCDRPMLLPFEPTLFLCFLNRFTNVVLPEH